MYTVVCVCSVAELMEEPDKVCRMLDVMSPSWLVVKVCELLLDMYNAGLTPLTSHTLPTSLNKIVSTITSFSVNNNKFMLSTCVY